MANETAEIEVKCPKCGRPSTICYQTGGVFAVAPTFTIVCQWDGCGHAWEQTFPGKLLSVGPQKSS
jgi:hypothetical protein